MPARGVLYPHRRVDFFFGFGFGGDGIVQSAFNNMPGGMWGALAIVMLVIFLLGFILDFIEITFVVVPIVGPALMAMGVDPI